MSEKGGIWTFKLHVNLPVRDSSAASFNPVHEAFRTVLMSGIPTCLSNVEIFVRCDCAALYEAQTSGSVAFEVHGFIQAGQSQVRETTLRQWLNQAQWTRITTALDKDIAYNSFITDETFKRVQIHGTPKNRSGRPRQVKKSQASDLHILKTECF